MAYSTFYSNITLYSTTPYSIPHSRYPDEFEATSSHKLRSSDDMQFSFSYFYFLMSERKVMDLSDTFLELDSDQSGWE